MTRRQVWEITERPDGMFTVTRGNREVRWSPVSSLEQARASIFRTRLLGEKVYKVDPDGYRTDLTRQFVLRTPARGIR